MTRYLNTVGRLWRSSAWPFRAYGVGFVLLTIAGLAAVVLILCRECDLHGLLAEVRLRSRAWIPDGLAGFIWTVLNVWPDLFISPLLDPSLYVVLAVLLTIERLLPARPQNLLSVGLAQDMLWSIIHSFLTVVVISAMMRGFYSFYQRHLSMLSIEGIQSWPLMAKIALALLFNDFLDWFHHVFRHKVWIFWSFHTVHHSQREMNMFTDDRVHVVDQAIANCLVCIPMFMFAVDAPMAAYVTLAIRWYPKLYHANIKANLGVLRYVLVTPQSHRLHHSIEPQHRDKNFGVIFSFWDRIFGTLHPDHDTYPATGIPDPDFPLERKATGMRVLSTYINQFLYPFTAIYRRFRGA